MVNPQFDLRNRLMIKKVCLEQLKALHNLTQIDEVIDKTNELSTREGIKVEIIDYISQVNSAIRVYQKVLSNPNSIFMVMDSVYISGIKSGIINTFSTKRKSTRRLFKKIYLSEDLMQRLN